MKKHILFSILFFGISFNARSQTEAIRDSIVGTYIGTRYVYDNGTSFTDPDIIWILPYSTDSIKFTVYDSLTSTWNSTMTLLTDTTFEDLLVCPTCFHGIYYPTDSIYIFRWGMTTSNYFFNYNLKKISGSVGINELTQNNSFVIYPNPAKNKLTITTLTNYKNLKVVFNNIFGEKILEKEYQNNNSSIELDITKIKNGIYFLLLDQGEKKKVFKIIIQH